MRIIGINTTRTEDGRTNTTLHVAEEFPDYYNNPEKGRSCVGQRADSIYVGTYDCSAFKPNMEIEILFDRAVSTKNGVYQPIKRIEVVSNNK